MILLLLAQVAAPTQAPAVKVAAAARAIQPGEVVVLTITTAAPVEALTIRAFDRNWPSFHESPTSWRALIGIDLDVKAGRHEVAIISGPGAGDRITYPLNVLAKKFPTRQLKVDDAFVNPPPEVLPRIQEDAARLNRLWAASSTAKLWTGKWVRPVSDPANSAFGTRSVFNGESRNPHSGADFLSSAGTPVKAPNAGRVVLAGDLYFTGNTVVIDHGLGLFSLFAHLRALSVHDGDVVTAGQIVGEVGATGRVTGPHLHWTVRLNDARVDPLSLLAVLQ